MAISDTIKNAVIRAAQINRIEPAALLAVVEIESSGKMFEEDGRTPRLLFERHVFHRELAKREPEKLGLAVSAGLAIPKWSRSTQYKDQGTSKNRLALLASARSIDSECANRSCSWGLGQTMGFNAEGLGFRNATELVEFMQQGGVHAQVECMVREIRRNKLEKALARKDWAAFAKGYNGPGYAQNKYDVKLEAAYRKWAAALDPDDPETGDAPVDMPDTRMAEPDPMSKSTIGNGSIVTGGAVTTGAGAIIADRAINAATDKAGDIADKALDGATKAVFTWPTLIALVCFLIALGACGYIWWQRREMKKVAGV